MNFKASIPVLIVAALLLAACGAASPQPTPTPLPSSTPAATSTATLTATPTTEPTAVSTATPEATPTTAPTDTPEAVVLPEPQGTPAAEWEGFPVMPGAAAGEADDSSYRFTIDASAEEVQAFYEQELQKLGWTLLGSGAGTTKALLLIFMNGAETLSIAVLPPETEGGLVQVMLVK